jgi:hypothetical protein
MKRFAAKMFLFGVLAAALMSLNGCASDEPQNNSVRPWDTPQGWQNQMPIQQQQHE